MLQFEVELLVFENGRKSPLYTLDTDLAGEVTLDDFLAFTKQSLIVIADQTLAEEQALGFDKNPVIAVDGRVGKPIEAVNPLGKIDITSRVNVDEVILETYEAIREKSPVLTGRYVKSNYVFLNGTQVATDLTSLQAWLAAKPEFQQKDLIRFVNIQPYARKLERLGVTVSRTHSRTTKSRDERGRSGIGGRVLAPNGTYFLTARAIRRKYKRNSIVKFSFIPGSSLGISGSFLTGSSGARGGGRVKLKKPGRTYLYPSITISVQESGIE